LEETDFGPDGVRKLLAEGNEYVLSGKVELQKKLDKKQIQDSVYVNMLTDLKKKDQALKVLIKTDDKATCKNFIDLIDELKIAEIGVVAPVEIMASELELLKEKLK
jgi:biopolymer transport protein ExbD